jgi:predicted phage terminase large subunit-like protein
MQRLHEADLTGLLLRAHGSALCLPAVAEKDEDIALPSGRTIHRAIGSLLDPVRLGVPVLAQLKIDIGTYAFNGQYQQRPAPAEGGIFRKDWWQSYDAPPSFDIMCLSLDATFKDNVDSDYVCIQVWGFIGPRAYLVDRIHDRLSYVATRDAFERMILKYPEAHARLVEDKANGSAIISELSLKYTGIIAINPEGGKVSRAHAVSPDVEAHNVYLPKTAWAQDVIDEAAAFPNAANDDDVDAMTQALNWRRQHRLGLGLIYNWQSGWLFDDEHRPIALYGNGGFEQHIIGVSSGVRTPTAFVEGIDDGTDLWACREYYYDPVQRMKTEKETVDDLEAFIAASKVTSPRPMIVVAPESTLVPELRERGYWVVEGNEDELDGIRRLSVAMQRSHIRVKKECVNLIRELSLFAWSDKKDEPKRENDSTTNALRLVGGRVFFDWRLS